MTDKMSVGYTKAQVLQCISAMIDEVQNRMAVRWAVEGKVQDPIVLMREMIVEGATSLPDNAPEAYR